MAVDGRQWSNGDGETDCQTSDRTGTLVSKNEAGKQKPDSLWREKYNVSVKSEQEHNK